MLLIDVNVLVYAHRPDAQDHKRYREWLERTLQSGATCGMPDVVLSGVIRIVTHPRIFREPTSVDLALRYATQLRNHPACIRVSPGDRHWEIFTRLCTVAGARGNLVSDAFLAALAIESGGEWITT